MPAEAAAADGRRSALGAAGQGADGKPACLRNSLEAGAEGDEFLASSWASLLRSLPGSSSLFGVFFKTWAAEGQKVACASASLEADTRGVADEGRPLLPMPLPFPAAEGNADTRHVPGRRTSRLRARRMAQRWANRLIGWISFCELGAPWR